MKYLTGALNGGAFWTAVAVGGAAVNLAKGDIRKAAMCAMAVPGATVVGAAVGWLGWTPVFDPSAARAAASRVVHKVTQSRFFRRWGDSA